VLHTCILWSPDLGMSHMKKFLTLFSICAFAIPAAAEDVQVESAPTQVRLKTNHGEILLELDAKKAPITAKNFIKYVGEKHYDGTVFHRVMDGFMIQGGGFALDGEKILERKTSGQGIKNESDNGLKNLRGTIAMARTADPNSARAQFFINVVDNPMLDYPSNGGYAVFGKVIEGMDVVDKIKGVQTGVSKIVMLHPQSGESLEMPAQNVPVEPVVIQSAEVVE